MAYMPKTRPTHVRVVLTPRSQKISIEACGPEAEGTIFAVDQAAEVYGLMVKVAKSTGKPLQIYQPDPAGKAPVILYNRYSGAPYMALVNEVKTSKKMVF